MFAQARAKARQASCLSNMKQLGLGVTQYMQDYDETVPVAHNCLSPDPAPSVTWFCGGVGDARLDWNEAVLPYVKSPMNGAGGGSVFFCPDLEADFFNQWSPNPTNGGVKWSQMFVAYGFNKDYLQPNRLCGTGDLLPRAARVWGQPAALADIDAPAATVLLVDTKPGVRLSDGGFYPSNLAFAPASLGPNARVCGLDGWGTNSAFEPAGLGGPNGARASATGSFSTRHSGGGNVAFCDGHVKWYTPGGLAAGTDWNAGKTTTQVQITDLTKYLWSLKKSGDSDI